MTAAARPERAGARFSTAGKNLPPDRLPGWIFSGIGHQMPS
jgi:hypothetical protein